MKSYTLWFVACLLGMSIFLVAFNWVVNPYLYFMPAVDIPGFNHKKFFAGIDGFRIWKSKKALDPQYDTVFIGSSRVMVGLDPDRLPGHRAFNLGLPLTNMYELERVAAFVARQDHIKDVVFGLDFLLFTDRRALFPAFHRSHFSGHASAVGELQDMFSFRTVMLSAATVGANLLDLNRDYMRDNGFMPRTTSTVRVRDRFDQILTLNFLINPGTYADFHYSDDRVNRFKQAVATLRQAGKQVRVFISPVHARQLLVLEEMGLWGTYKRWLTDVTQVVATLDAERPAEPIRLVNFSGFNRYTLEPIPRGQEFEMQWYFESSHYRHELGGLILDCLFAETPCRATDSFGAPLTPGRLDALLAEMDHGMETYMTSTPYEVEEVRRLIRQTAIYRKTRPSPESPAESGCCAPESGSAEGGQ